MKTAWILCFLTIQYGCVESTFEGKVLAYDSEIECNRAMKNFTKDARNDGKDILGSQCQSVESLLAEQATK